MRKFLTAQNSNLAMQFPCVEKQVPIIRKSLPEYHSKFFLIFDQNFITFVIFFSTPFQRMYGVVGEELKAQSLRSWIF